MTSKAKTSRKNQELRRLVGEERKLIQEKAALETMLKNVQSLRSKLKIEQMQLSTNLQDELGGRYVEVPVKALCESPEPIDIAKHEASISANKPALNLEISTHNNMFWGRDEEGEEYEEDDSDDEIGCAREVLGNQEESELNFEEF